MILPNFIVAILLLLSGCANTQGTELSAQASSPANDSSQINATILYAASNLAPYSKLSFVNDSKIYSGEGTKSIIFNSQMNTAYALNLEGMSVYEYSQSTKAIQRIFKFKPTPGTGWDYEKDIPIKSYQEKPVEACISNHDSIIWVSLHNAEGIVPIFLKGKNNRMSTSPSDKLVYETDSSGNVKDSFFVPLILTGKTPKVIVKSENDQFLVVSNWHSLTLSYLSIQPNKYPYAVVQKNIPVVGIPRGMVFDDKNKKTFVAIMGGATIASLDNTKLELDEYIQVASNPRHLVPGDSNRIFVSYNKTSTIACIDMITKKSLFTAPTESQPRTIAISRNRKFLFVTCYKGDKLMVFKIHNDHFEKISSLDCKGSPVGVDIYENDTQLEAWVCSYNGGLLSLYSFIKE